jgi:hypothetical protein
MRYHITRPKGQKTTVYLPPILSEMLALKLGYQPDEEDAIPAVRLWLQDCLDRSTDPGRIHVSQWLQAKIIETLVSPKLREQWGEWFDRAEAAGRYRIRHTRTKAKRS